MQVFEKIGDYQFHMYIRRDFDNLIDMMLNNGFKHKNLSVQFHKKINKLLLVAPLYLLC